MPDLPRHELLHRDGPISVYVIPGGYGLGLRGGSRLGLGGVYVYGFGVQLHEVRGWVRAREWDRAIPRVLGRDGPHG